MNGPDANLSPPSEPPVPPRRKRRWLRWLLLTGVATVGVGVVFYQPIGVWTLETAASSIARAANLDLSLKISGNLVSSITIENIHGTALGETPVRKLSVEKAEFHYSFPRMFRLGVADFLSSYHLRNATIEIDELPETASEDARTNSERLTALLRDILQQPALFSNRVELENVNIHLNLLDGPVIVDSLHILLDPTEPGFINVGRVEIPRLPSWHQLSAEATYNGRKLVLDKLELGDEMEVVHAELIPARVTGGEHILLAKIDFFGGKIAIDLRSQDEKASLELNVTDISLQRMSDYFQLEPGLEGTLKEFTADLRGAPETPNTWRGEFAIGLEEGRVDDLHVGNLQLHAKLEEGRFQLHDTRIVSHANELRLEGEQPFPGSFRELLAKGLELRYTLNSPKLKAWHPDLPDGHLEAKGTLLAGKEKLEITTEAKLADLLMEDEGKTLFSLAGGTVKAEASFRPEARKEGSPWFTGLKMSAAFQTTPGGEEIGMVLQSVALDRISLALRQEEGVVTLETLELQRAENNASASGTLRLPTSLEMTKAWEETEFDASLKLHAPELAAFNAPGVLQQVTGKLEINSAFQRRAGHTTGDGRIEASDLRWQEFAARSLSIHLPLEGTKIPRAHLKLVVNDTDALEATAEVNLQAPFDYKASLMGKIHDLAIFQPFVGKPLGGSFTVDWRGTGKLQPMEHTGEGSATLAEGRFDTYHPLALEAAARYTPQEVVLSRLQASAPQGNLTANARWAEQRLFIPDLKVDLGKHGALTGHLALPLDLREPSDPAKILPPEGVLEGSLVLKQINLATAFPPPAPPKEEKKGRRKKEAAPAPAGIAGLVDASLALGGTVKQPEVKLEVKGRDLRSNAVAKLEAATLDATVLLKDARLALRGEVRMPSIQPLRLEGSAPLDFHKVLKEKQVDPETPLKAAVVLPSSSARFLANVVPSLRYIEGNISLDAKAAGTISKPTFSGGLHFNLPAVRMSNTEIPGINNFRGDLLFGGDKLTMQRFDGDVAGGPFSLSGSVGLKDWAAPDLNLRFKSTNTLLVRNDSVTVRADSNLKIAGPLKTASVKGKVVLRKSRFYRDVEILPLALPGKPVAEPVESTAEVSIDVPPIRDWSFDIAVRTKEPFLIRSNMARGGAVIDLRVGGTGLSPTLDGVVKIENLVASLPFSRLQIEHGFVRFNPADSFNPSFDIHGSSRLRNTMVHAHIYGTASDPETIFTSEPPLPQEEIIALLATGATTQGLADNNEVMAGRAGSLLLQDLYHKISRKRPKKNNEDKLGDDPLGDRFSLDVGTVDPRTGRQEVGGRLRLNKEFEVGAGLDVEGDVRVQLRYLLRFR